MTRPIGERWPEVWIDDVHGEFQVGPDDDPTWVGDAGMLGRYNSLRAEAMRLKEQLERVSNERDNLVDDLQCKAADIEDLRAQLENCS